MNQLQNTFRYCVDYETESYSEDTGSDDQYHRYRNTITGVKINEVYYKQILEKIVGKGPQDALRLYILDRYLHVNLKPEDFTAHWSGSYYGDEVSSIELVEDKFNALNSFTSALAAAKNVTPFLKQTLMDEYGWLTPAIEETKKWHIIEVDKTEIEIPQTEYVRKLDKGRIKWYTDNHKKQSCLAVYRDGKLVLVDGYHRYAAAKSSISVVCPL